MQELTRAQKEYFKDSKIRDENGELLVVYNAVIPKSDGTLEYRPTSYTDPSYLKADTEFSVVGMYINAKNPFEYQGKELKEYGDKHGFKTYADMVQHLKKEGYDAIIGTNAAGVKEVTIFEPNQMKSMGNLYPTKSDYSLDNSAEYHRINFCKMTVNEHLEMARTGSLRAGSIQEGNKTRKRDEQER